MVNKHITKNKIKQINRSPEVGRGTKHGSTLRVISRKTVQLYFRRFKEARLTLDQAEEMTDSEMANMLINTTELAFDKERLEVLQPELPAIDNAIPRRE